MELREKYTLTLRSVLAELLSSIDQKIELWHYGILLPESNSSSLASLLQLSKTQLVNILHLCGLLSINKDGIYKLTTNQTLKKESYCWNDLLKGAGMDDNYFDKMKVASVKEIKAQIWWLGIGDIDQQTQSNPSKQFKFLPNGPIQLEDSLKEEVKKSSKYMTSIAELIEEEVSEKVDIIDTDFNINSESTCHSSPVSSCT